MAGFDREILDAAAREKEVALTTDGRRTGKPARVTLWVSTDGERLFIRSGGGLGRDWPQNLLANGRGMLHLAGRDVPIRPRHLTNPAEARAVTELVIRKYGAAAQRPAAGAPPTPGELATFELLPDSAAGGD